jgi:sn-glycerol 3-phosphate transport system substrate-binding protein
MKKLRFLSTLATLFIMVIFTVQAAPKKIVFWHSMGGNLQKSVEKIVKDYNSSQDKYEIEAIYQGSYDETLNKFRAVAGTKEAPSIVQVYEIGTQFMINSGYITPIQELMEADNYDSSKLEDFILNYYRVDGKLYSMPFNSSSAIMIYNKDAFKKAGLNPNKGPQSFSELKKVAKKLTESKETKYGFAMLMHGWFFEQMMANSKEYYANKNNGRDGIPTKVNFNNKAGKEIFSMLRDMYKEGTAESFGRSWSDIRNAFISKQVGIYLDSSSGLRDIIDNADFEVGVSFLPGPNKEFYGALIGGASLWVSNSVSKDEQKGAWDFLKFAASPSEQAYWANSTGYYPINKDAYKEASLIENNKKYPQMTIATAQIQKSVKSKYTQGALLGTFPEIRQKVVIALEENYEGKKSIDKILKQLESDCNKIIKRYNMLNN